MAKVFQTLNKLSQAVGKVTSAGSGSDPYGPFSELYEKEKDGAIEGGGKAPGVQSLFNAFNIFRYSKFGLNTETYDIEKHMDSPTNEDAPAIKEYVNKISKKTRELVGDDIADKFKTFNDERQKIENPSASTIIEWARNQGGGEPNNPISPMPYTSSDFLWCKYYGKVPNNRMLTLRRYAVPIEDNLANLSKNQSPFTPLAQAVSWYGKDIENDLNKILNIDWGLGWLPKDADVTDVTGNEISVDDLLSELGVSGKNSAVYTGVKNALFAGNDSVSMAEISGYDVKMNKYIKESYGKSGPYWNRVLGPVNVVNKTLTRTRGYDYMKDIELNFEYSLRSYGNINPKIAFIDLLTNFLSLTYNTAPFWGGAVRYFAKTGVKLDPTGMESNILNADMPGALRQGIETISAQVKSNLDHYASVIQETVQAVENAKGKTAIDQSKGNYQKLDSKGTAGLADKLIAGKLGALMQAPLSYRSLLDGRAIGEWHLTVGNPMNPMAMIGNLVVESVDMTFGEVLGIDDFPTEFKFKVKLKHGRPRAKQDIESIFNLGNGFMTTSAIAPPSSAMNTLGEYNNKKGFIGKNELDGIKKGKTSLAQAPDADSLDPESPDVANARKTISTFYGQPYGNSDSVPNYFKNYVTKD